MEDIHLISQLT